MYAHPFGIAGLKAMGVFFDEPGYPVIDKAPQFWKTGDLVNRLCFVLAEGLALRTDCDNVATFAVGNFNVKDWATFAGVPAVCYPFGWAVGNKHANLHQRFVGSRSYSRHVSGVICCLRRWSQAAKTVCSHGHNHWRARWFHASIPAVLRYAANANSYQLCGLDCIVVLYRTSHGFLPQ